MSLPNLDVKITCSIVSEEKGSFGVKPGLVFLFCLSGENTVWIGLEQIVLQPAGMVVINPLEPYSIECAKGGKMVSMLIPRDFLRFGRYNYEEQEILCKVNDNAPGTDKVYDHLRMQYAKIFNEYLKEDTAPSKIVSDTLMLLETLVKYFATSTKQRQNQKQAEITDRLIRIIDYCHAHWKEDISLAMLAEAVHLTPNYLSRFMKQHLHVTFLAYINSIRMQYARYEIVRSKKSITQIAYESGFHNTTSFISQFSKLFHMTPNEYRKNNSAAMLDKYGSNGNLEPEEQISMLLRYTDHTAALEDAEDAPVENRFISIDCAVKGKKWGQGWKRLLNLGFAKDGLNGSVQRMLTLTQRDLGFEYVRFCGIFHHSMKLYSIAEDGNEHFAFAQLDMLIDFFYSIRLLPFVELGMIPEPLIIRHSDSESTFDEQGWTRVIQRTIRHFLRRFGREEVRKWRFTLPGLKLSDESYISVVSWMRLYCLTYRTIKDIDERILIGGPGRMPGESGDPSALPDFMNVADQQHCIPDFFTATCYPESVPEDKTDFVKEDHFTRRFLADFRKSLQGMPCEDLEIWVEDWNVVPWLEDMAGDTCYRASLLVQYLHENCSSADAFTFGKLTDYTEERMLSDDVFQQGYGLFSYQGLPKAGWNAMKLLGHLGNRVIATGDGYLVTCDGDNLQILMTRYCQYHHLYRHQYQMPESRESVFSIFQTKSALRYNLEIYGLQEGLYRVSQYSIAKSHGSVFEQWMEMGMPEFLRGEELNYLHSVSKPLYRTSITNVKKDFRFDLVLQPLETLLITIEKV